MRRLKKKAVLTVSAAIAAAGLLYTCRVPVSEALHLQNSRSDEYEVPVSRKAKSLQEWKEINPDVWCVLNFSQTEQTLSIPVMKTVDPDYYMTHNPWRQKDTMGSLFLDETECPAEQAQNDLIFGHSSKTKNWNLTFLKQYQETEYYQDHSRFTAETEEGLQNYQVVSFGRYDLSEEDVYLGWHDNQYGNTEETLEMFHSSEPYLLQKTDGIVYQGQKIMTLVTCDMSEPDSRFVLQAVQI